MAPNRAQVFEYLSRLAPTDWARFKALDLTADGRRIAQGRGGRQAEILALLDHYDTDYRGLSLLVPDAEQPPPDAPRRTLYQELDGMSPGDFSRLVGVFLDRTARGEVQGVPGRQEQIFRLLDHFDVSHRGLHELESAWRQTLGDAIAPSGATFEVQRGGESLGTALGGDGVERTLRSWLATVNLDDWWDHLGQARARVCRVETEHGFGTGFLVGRDRVLTARHVLRRQVDDGADASLVRFRFDVFREADVGVTARLADDWLVATGLENPDEVLGRTAQAEPQPDQLDFVLCQLREPPTGPDRGGFALPADPPALAQGAPILIPQHPNAGPLRFAFDTSAVQGLVHGGLRLRYFTNTDEGASGAPVFDAHWRLVAMHHYGSGAFQFNQGIPIALIRSAIAAQAPA